MKYSITFIIFFTNTILLAQDKIGMDITLNYSRSADGTAILTAEVYDEEEYEAITDLEFAFYSIRDEEERLLGTAFSDEESMVRLEGISFENILRDESDYMTFRFAGENDMYAGMAEILIRHVDLVMNFELDEDSVKVLSVNLTGKDAGEEVGIEDGEVYFFIPRLYGNLAIGDVWTDENGYDKMDFPVDIPGNEKGNLIVIARITESDEFGSIETREEINWGIPTSVEALDERQLWSPNAPRWMVITFAILITGVFAHYIWVIINLIRIKKMGRT